MKSSRVVSSFKPCIVIPYFNHGRRLLSVLESFSYLNLTTIVVDDGSTEEESRQVLDEIRESVFLLSNEINRGKGFALGRGLSHAYHLGFSHALCVDADGQHDASDAKAFLASAEQHASTIVLALPQFDEDAPWERVWGRKLSTLMVWLQTQSTAVKDILCGYRVYPLEPIVSLLHSVKSERMGTDIELVVRYIWAGGRVTHVDTHVCYPQNGRSHFRYIRDNCQLAQLHLTLLAVGFSRRFSPGSWFQRPELGSELGLRALVKFYETFGFTATQILLYPLSFLYFLAVPEARRAVLNFQNKVLQGQSTAVGRRISSYLTFLRFSRSIMDSVRAWKGEIDPRKIKWHGVESIYRHLEQGKGGIVLTAHCGPIEACRAVHRVKEGLVIKSVMYLENSRKFRRVLEAIAPDANHRIIELEDISISSLNVLQKTLDEGGFIGLMGDRITPNTRERYRIKKFFGQDAYFPEGPFLLAALFKVPVFGLFAAYGQAGGEFVAHWSEFTFPADATRDEVIESLLTQYVEKLEYHCRRYPDNFFNFFDFWSSPMQQDVVLPLLQRS